MIMSLIAMSFCIMLYVISIDYVIKYNKTNKLKNDLNTAVHAASLSIDDIMLARGNFRLDTATPGKSAQDMFYKYLRMNMKLDNTNKAMEGSRVDIGSQINVNELLYVNYEEGTILNLNSRPSGCTYSRLTKVVACTVTLNNGAKDQISRTINQVIAGPSIVAIVSSKHDGIGLASNEPILLPAVQEVYIRK